MEQIQSSTSIEDYFQASGRRGQSGDSAYSIVYRTPLKIAKLVTGYKKKRARLS